jgi:hypothetical protein
MKTKKSVLLMVLLGGLLALMLAGCAEVEDETNAIDPVYRSSTKGTLRNEDGSNNQPVVIGSQSMAYTDGRHSIGDLRTSGGDTLTSGSNFGYGSTSSSYSWAYLYKGSEKIGIVFQRTGSVSVPYYNGGGKVVTYYLGKALCDQAAVPQIRSVFGSTCDTSDMSTAYYGSGARAIGL